MKFLLFLKKLFILIITAFFTISILSIVFVVTMFYFYPNEKVENYTRTKALSIMNMDIIIKDSEIEKVIFAQSMYLTFLWDGWHYMLVELTKEGTKRLISNKTKIWEFEYKEISSLNKCSFIDYKNNRKNVEINSDFNNGKFYYVSQKDDSKWTKIIIIDEKINTMYYCSYRT